MKDRELVYSAVKTPDGTIIESRYRHDYVTYIDKNGKEYMIDGGLDYQRYNTHGDEEVIAVYSDEPYEKVRQYAFRGGYGKDGKGEYRITRLKDMSDEYLESALHYVMITHNDLTSEHSRLLREEKEYRLINNIQIND